MFMKSAGLGSVAVPKRRHTPTRHSGMRHLAQTPDVPLHIGESRDSGFALCAPSDAPIGASGNDEERLRRDAMRGDDLIGGAAGDFGHAVELPCETAGTGGRPPPP